MKVKGSISFTDYFSPKLTQNKVKSTDGQIGLNVAKKKCKAYTHSEFPVNVFDSESLVYLNLFMRTL